MMDDTDDDKSTISWLRDKVPLRRPSPTDFVSSSPSRRRVPAGVRVLLALLPLVVFLSVFLFLVVARHDRFSVITGASSVPPTLSKADKKLLHNYPELFLLQNSSYTLENGTVLYTIEPSVMQLWVEEVRASQRVYSFLTFLFVLIIVLVSFKSVVVSLWALLALLGKPCPRWLDMLV